MTSSYAFRMSLFFQTAHESNIAFYETHKIKNIPIGSNYVVHACRQGDPASNCDIFVCPAKAQVSSEIIKWYEIIITVHSGGLDH